MRLSNPFHVILGSISFLILLPLIGVATAQPHEEIDRTRETTKSGSSYNAYVIERFDVSARLVSSGTLFVREKIDVVFNSERHGIVRKLPLTLPASSSPSPQLVYDNISVSNEDGSRPSFAVNRGDATLSIQIGNEAKLIRGAKRYLIRYRVANVLNDSALDSGLRWFVTGDEWNAPIRKVQFDLVIPKGPEGIEHEARIEAVVGGMERHYLIKGVTDGNVLRITHDNALGPNEGMTVAAYFPPSLFFARGSKNEARIGQAIRGLKISALMVLGFVVVLGGQLICALIVGPCSGKDEVIGSRPQSLSPLEASILKQGRLTSHGLRAGVASLLRAGLIDESGGVGSTKKERTAAVPHGDKKLLSILSDHPFSSALPAYEAEQATLARLAHRGLIKAPQKASPLPWIFCRIGASICVALAWALSTESEEFPYVITILLGVFVWFRLSSRRGHWSWLLAILALIATQLGPWQAGILIVQGNWQKFGATALPLLTMGFTTLIAYPLLMICRRNGAVFWRTSRGRIALNEGPDIEFRPKVFGWAKTVKLALFDKPLPIHVGRGRTMRHGSHPIGTIGNDAGDFNDSSSTTSSGNGDTRNSSGGGTDW